MRSAPIVWALMLLAGGARAEPAFRLGTVESAYDAPYATFGPQGTPVWEEFRKHYEDQTPAYPAARGEALGESQVRFSEVRQICDPGFECSYVGPGMFFLSQPAQRSPEHAGFLLVGMEEAGAPAVFDLRVGFVEDGAQEAGRRCAMR